jgi:phosphorylase kinase alpha/beta subunit
MPPHLPSNLRMRNGDGDSTLSLNALKLSASTIDQLNHYYETVKDIILSRQNACTGLIPASTAVNTHGDYRDAWVRDNVYSILVVFGLSLAYNRIDDDSGKAYEVKCLKLLQLLLTLSYMISWSILS